MKKLFVFLTVFAMVFAFTACDFETTVSSDESEGIESAVTGFVSNEPANSESTTDDISSKTQSHNEESVTSSSAPSSSEPSSSVTSSSKPGAAKPSSSVTSSSKPSSTADSKPTTSVQPTTPTEVTVWIPTNGGKKYHSKSSCSGMKNPSKVTKDEAVSLGFGPCGRCY